MPEGPEVRIVSEQLRPQLLNSVLVDIRVRDRARERRVTGRNCLAGILDTAGATIIAVAAHGKKIIVTLQSGVSVVISLLMEGHLNFQSNGWSYIELILRGSTLYFDDRRQLGLVAVYAAGVSPIDKLGPDLLEAALTTWIDSSTWLGRMKPRRRSTQVICARLLDQQRVAGIGNYLKSEILYEARIHPERLTCDVTDTEWETLRQLSHTIIKLAYEHNGLTIATFKAPNGCAGSYPVKVYRLKQTTDGQPVTHRKTRDGRGSHWVEGYQT
jgi:DNA-formamidopyrimidine glycosylase